MLNKNLDLDLHDYITVDFNAVVKAVDLIGGVDVEVTEEEIPYINGYQSENAEVTGAEITPVESAGYQHLNGIQARAYCRIRYTGDDCYEVTNHSRKGIVIDGKRVVSGNGIQVRSGTTLILSSRYLVDLL